MYIIKKYFPHASNADNLKGLLTAIFIYVIVNFVGGLVFGIFSKLPLVGFIASFAGWLLGIYCAAGAILAILLFLHILN